PAVLPTRLAWPGDAGFTADQDAAKLGTALLSPSRLEPSAVKSRRCCRPSACSSGRSTHLPPDSAGSEPGRQGEPAMAFDEALAERILQSLAGRKDVGERKMFGCIAFLLGGNAVAGVWKRSLIVRVGPDGYEEALLEPHAREFDITGRPMRCWVVVGPDGVEDDGHLGEWSGGRASSWG